MKNQRLGANVLSVQIIPNVDAGLATQLGLTSAQRSLGIITACCLG